MEFPFNINHLLGETINKLDSSVRPYRKNADGYGYEELRKLLMQVIDRMGEASSRAQGLRTIITTGRKLELSDHILYVMRDNELNNGKGAVVGILKIGSKRLFVYDSRGRVHEMNPLCVLDFYVHESRQRMGCGRLLFDYMLKDQNVKAVHLAIDKPSFKFSSFLKKHYNLNVELPQVNNFVVYEGFFNGRVDLNRGRTIMGRPPSYPRYLNEGKGDVVLNRQGSVYSNFGRHNNSSRPPSGVHSHHSSPRRKDTVESHSNRMLIFCLISAHPDIRVPVNHNTRQYGASITNYSRHGSTPPGSRPDSGKRRSSGKGDRNQNADNAYQEKMNLHQDYQGRNGHLRVGSNGSLPSLANKSNLIQLNDNKNLPADLFPGIPTPWRGTTYNWSPSGPPSNHQTIGARHYTHTRLW
ncbi:hypothetical protein FSP39_023687 [Pinctada imbricata]|uniref:Alpha-tubulin N-acetyltransferase n=1 Tax=Pinctada imbricata TaxID=66713 RepID=A0AA89BZU7_PINIB|nr:hypothetical protein FSP39_023687 [Pinctada imbricata]